MIVPNALAIMTVIQTYHPGGLEAFRDEGGSATLIPAPFKQLLILHPNLSQEIRSKVIKASEGMDVTVLFLTEGHNLTIEFIQEVSDKLYETGFELVDVTPSEATLDLRFPNVRLKDKRISTLKRRLKSIPGFVRAHITLSNGKDVWTLTDKEQKILKKKEKVQEELKPNRFILEDDVLNLRIALETMDVDTFINSL